MARIATAISFVSARRSKLAAARSPRAVLDDSHVDPRNPSFHDDPRTWRRVETGGEPASTQGIPPPTLPALPAAAAAAPALPADGVAADHLEGAPERASPEPSDDTDYFRAKGRPARGGLHIGLGTPGLGPPSMPTVAPSAPSAEESPSTMTDLSAASSPPRSTPMRHLRQPDFEVFDGGGPATVIRERGGRTPMRASSRSAASRQAQLSWLSHRVESALDDSQSTPASSVASLASPPPRAPPAPSPRSVASPEAMSRVAALDPDRSSDGQAASPSASAMPQADLAAAKGGYHADEGGHHAAEGGYHHAAEGGYHHAAVAELQPAVDGAAAEGEQANKAAAKKPAAKKK